MEENLYQDLSLEDELWARVIALEMLRYTRRTGKRMMDSRVDSGAVRILSEIKKTLDDPSLDDSDCFLHIDAVVDEFFKAGLSTRRHEECE